LKPSVFLADEQDEDVSVEPLRQLVFNTLTHERYPSEVEVTVVLVDEGAMASYNERFMEKTGPTDVLSFPLEHLVYDEAPTYQVGEPPINLGDVIIAPTYVRRQADERGVVFEDEMALMVVHGMLHLMGWDHLSDEEADYMEAREAAILKTIGKKRP
jgi:probable rRNA maturation factor